MGMGKKEKERQWGRNYKLGLTRLLWGLSVDLTIAISIKVRISTKSSKSRLLLLMFFFPFFMGRPLIECTTVIGP